LGISITREHNIFRLSQGQYVRTLLERFGMAGCRPVSTPLDTSASLQSEGELLNTADAHSYRSCVGALGYLAQSTRPDIATAVGKLGQYPAAPT